MIFCKWFKPTQIIYQNKVCKRMSHFVLVSGLGDDWRWKNYRLKSQVPHLCLRPLFLARCLQWGGGSNSPWAKELRWTSHMSRRRRTVAEMAEEATVVFDSTCGIAHRHWQMEARRLGAWVLGLPNAGALTSADEGAPKMVDRR